MLPASPLWFAAPNDANRISWQSQERELAASAVRSLRGLGTPPHHPRHTDFDHEREWTRRKRLHLIAAMYRAAGSNEAEMYGAKRAKNTREHDVCSASCIAVDRTYRLICALRQPPECTALQKHPALVKWSYSEGGAWAPPGTQGGPHLGPPRWPRPPQIPSKRLQK